MNFVPLRIAVIIWIAEIILLLLLLLLLLSLQFKGINMKLHTCYVIKHGQQSQHHFVFAGPLVSAALLTHTGFAISLPTGFAFTLSSSSNERPHTKCIDVTNHSVTCAIRWKTHGRTLGERLRRVRVTKSNTTSTCSHPHNLHIDRLTYKETKKQCNPPQYSHETRYQ